MHAKKIFFLLASFLLLASCSTPRPEGQTEAEVLFREAEDLASKKRYIMASEKLNLIRSQFPYSYFATHAELLQADILFDQSNYTEAAAAYILFRDFHPRHEKIDYVIWRTAESFYLQLPSTFDRDLTAGTEALRYYREIMRNFSTSSYAAQAQTRIEAIEKMNLAKEKYIADFYFRTKVYTSARHRYLEMITTIADPEVVGMSVLRVLESSLFLKERAACENYYRQFHQLVEERFKGQIESVYNRCTQLQQG